MGLPIQTGEKMRCVLTRNLRQRHTLVPCFSFLSSHAFPQHDQRRDTICQPHHSSTVMRRGDFCPTKTHQVQSTMRSKPPSRTHWRSAKDMKRYVDITTSNAHVSQPSDDSYESARLSCDSESASHKFQLDHLNQVTILLKKVSHLR